MCGSMAGIQSPTTENRRGKKKKKKDRNHQTWVNYKFCENRARDASLRGVYIPNFDQISVIISVLGVPYPYCCTDGDNLAWRRGPLPHAKFHPHRCNMSPLRGEKPQNRPLSKLNTGALRCAQCCRQNCGFWPPEANAMNTFT